MQEIRGFKSGAGYNGVCMLYGKRVKLTIVCTFLCIRFQRANKIELFRFGQMIILRSFCFLGGTKPLKLRINPDATRARHRGKDMCLSKVHQWLFVTQGPMSAALHRRAARRTVGQDCQKCKETYLSDQGKKKNGLTCLALQWINNKWVHMQKT